MTDGTTGVPRDGQNRYGLPPGERAWGLAHKFAVSNGVYKVNREEDEQRNERAFEPDEESSDMEFVLTRGGV